MAGATKRKSRPPAAPLGSFTEAFTKLRSDHNTSKSNRFRRTRAGVSAVGRPADFHYRSEAAYLRMMELSRDMDRRSKFCYTPQVHVGLDLPNATAL